VARRILWSSLALAPVAILARFVFHADETTLFVLSAIALIPLAWVIGEATEHAAAHTGGMTVVRIKIQRFAWTRAVTGIFAISSDDGGSGNGRHA